MKINLKEKIEDALKVDFWQEIKVSDEKTKLVIIHRKIYELLSNVGFCKIRIETQNGIKLELARIIDNVVELVTIDDAQSYISTYINRLPNMITDNHSKAELKELFTKGINIYVCNAKFNTIPHRRLNFIKDTDEQMYFFFRNGFVEIKQDKIKLKPYTQLNGYIWKSQIMDFDIDIDNNDVSDFEQFVKNVCSDPDNNNLFDNDRYNSLRTVIGYLLNTYRNQSYMKAIVLTESSMSENPQGRVGKGLLLQSIGKLRKRTVIDGRNFRFDTSFAFQQMSLDTKILHFDDINKRFPFERLFSSITDGLSFERKGRDRIHLKPEDSPRIVLSTNYAINDDGSGSAIARKFEMELFTYYSKDHEPIDDFGKMFFSGWDDKEWNSFYRYMFDCSQFFLSNNSKLLPYHSDTKEKKKLLMNTSADFIEFMYDYFEGATGEQKILAGDLKDNIKREVDPDLTDTIIGRWIKMFAKSNGIEFDSRPERINGNVYRYYFFKFN